MVPQAGIGEISLRYSSLISGVGSVELPHQDYWAQQTFTGNTAPENSQQTGEVINTDFEPSEQAGLMLLHNRWSAVPATYYCNDDTTPAYNYSSS